MIRLQLECICYQKLIYNIISTYKKTMNDKIKKALVISGGGAKGAFGGGVAEYLVNKLGKDYDYYVGSSTGNLLLGLIATGDFETLKEAYTSVTNQIYSQLTHLRLVKMKMV